ncbi:uncharacterized protein LOC133189429 [Saccostrea echinata]|uniref:uncharacterized protein LOC133189429 n=1 Tax=Saccostrea echinata TaxID=191078 RepID=UPI002A81E5E1|nr:uncharacterized protein LOC133189429 [Saccostrea echinata]
MGVLFFINFLLLIRTDFCYDNLSRKNTTQLSQSSTYNDRDASLANDGVLRTTEKYCAHTAPWNTNSPAWFQVDLGRPYSIKSVKIYYRKEGDQQNDWKQFRFRQFYLDVSDSPAASTTTSQRTRCYTDNSTYPDLPDNIIDIPCEQTVRYIIVETKYISIESRDTSPILEICEIEVYGCDIGYYGLFCSSCGDCENCNIEKGCFVIKILANVIEVAKMDFMVPSATCHVVPIVHRLAVIPKMELVSEDVNQTGQESSVMNVTQNITGLIVPRNVRLHAKMDATETMVVAKIVLMENLESLVKKDVEQGAIPTVLKMMENVRAKQAGKRTFVMVKHEKDIN